MVSLTADVDEIHNESLYPNGKHLTLRTGGPQVCKEDVEGCDIGIFVNANLFTMSIEDRNFLLRLVDLIRDYAKTHPLVPKDPGVLDED